MGLLQALGLTAVSKVSPAPMGAATLGAAPPAAAPPVDKNVAAYQTARAAAVKQLDELKAHPQALHLGAEIAQANAKLVAADGAAGATKWKDASARLAEMHAIVSAAQKLAKDWANYAAKRAVANALVFALKDPDDPKWFKDRQADLTGADNLAAGPPPNFAAALKVLKQLEGDTRPDVKNSVDLVKKRLKECESADPKAREFLKDDIAGAKPLVAASEKALADGEFAKAMQISGAALEILGPGHRLISRRDGFEKQRVTTVAAINKVRAKHGVEDRAAALDKMVADADKLAARDSMRIEDGKKLLADAAAKAGVLLALAPVIAGCATERGIADTELAALDKHAAAARISAEREAIRKRLADAKTASTQADAAPDPTAGWNSALVMLKQARADLAVAKKLADGFGPAAAAETAAKGADPKAMQAALAQLRADAKVAAKAPHAKAADAEFKRFEQRAADADKALAAADAKTAAPALNDAAQALVAAKTIQAEHAQFETTLAHVEGVLKKLNASPRAASIKARIDAAAALLAQAKAKDQAHDGPGAIAALRQADVASAAAHQADVDREHFDNEAKALGKRIAGTKDAAEKKKLEDAVTAAKGKADAFDFAAAGKALDQVEVGLDKLKLKSMLTAKPDEKGIAALADKMVKKGGAAEVDAMIQGVPDGGDARLVNAMATGRYGIKFKTGKPLKADGVNVIQSGDEAKAMKAVCAMFATIPEDVRGNPSIKSVSHEDAEGKAGGGYAFDDGTIEMDGRPNAIKQKFGSKLKTKDPKTGALVDQLPAAIDPKCKPVNENELDFLAFAAAHEVGHGVDDKKSFMQQHQSDAKYGGWIVYGASVEPLAEIVAKRYGLEKVAEQKKYVLDMLQSKPPTRPAVAAGSAEDLALKGFEQWHAVATAHNVYRRQGDCDFLKIGDYVYHEAYARNWVGYLHAARNKGLTGYQFRAPGEWFAELYAGFRSGKLGPDHPAREWLTKL